MNREHDAIRDVTVTALGRTRRGRTIFTVVLTFVLVLLVGRDRLFERTMP